MKFYCQHIDWHINIHQNDESLPWFMMMHGFMGSGDVFNPLIPLLSHFCNPVTIDLPGHGRSGGSDDPGQYREEIQVRCLLSVLKRLQFKPLILHGYSMGGRLAIQFAVQHPEIIDALVLESTTCGVLNPEEQVERRDRDEYLAENILKNYSDFLLNWKALSLFDSPSVDEEYQRLYDDIMNQQNPTYISACLRGFGSGAMTQRLDELSTLEKPVCLIAGEHDEKFISIHKTMHRKIPGSEMHIIQGAGHRVHMDQPEAFIRQIKTFIKKQRYELENH